MVVVRFNREVVVEGVPVLSLNIDSNATYVSGSGTDTLLFAFTAK